MKQYNLMNRCLSTLKASRMDVMTKLRMETLLSGITSLVLVDLQQENAPELEALLRHVNEVCTGEAVDGAKGLLEHMRKMQSSLSTCLTPSCY